MNNVLKKIEKMKIIPVVKIDASANALPLADALKAGGLPCTEITFRTDAAEETIRQLSRLEDFLVGAGTVLSVETAKKAIGAGAKFVVSPGLNPKVVRYCLDNDVPVTPGVATPTDIEAALDLGLDILKFFPAEALGGMGILKAISAPYGMVRFIPTGGVNTGNLLDYLKFPSVFAVGGTWIAKADLINAGAFNKISAIAREAVALAQQAGE